MVSHILQDILTSLLPIDKPQEDPNIRGDAFKTLIVSRLSYEATEKDLESEFGRFGPIERVSSVLVFRPLDSDLCLLQIRIVTDTHQDEKPNKKKKKHRGYAFVVYEREKDMRGKITRTPNTPDLAFRISKHDLICKDMDLKLPIFFIFCLRPSSRYIKYGQHD